MRKLILFCLALMLTSAFFSQFAYCDKNTDLLNALIDSDEDEVRSLIQQGASVKAVGTGDYAGWTTLHYSVYYQSVDISKFLIEKGANVNAVGTGEYNGWTPLHFATNNQDIDLMTLLIDHGAKVDAPIGTGDWDKWTPLHIAVHYKYPEIVKFLIEHGANIEAKTGKYYDIQSGITQNGHTPLHIAAHKGHIDLITYLLEKGAKPNSQDNNGATPIHFAATDAVVRLLVDHKADLKVKTKSGKTAEQSTRENKHFSAANYLKILK